MNFFKKLLILTITSSCILIGASFTKANSKAIQQDFLKDYNNKKNDLTFKTKVAIHETGHVLVAYLSKVKIKKVTIKVTIVEEEIANGNTILTYNDKLTSKKDLINIYLAGLTAEEVIYGKKLSSYLHKDDLLSAKKLANKLTKNNEAKSEILLQEQLIKTKKLIENNKELFIKIFIELLDKKTLTGEQINKITQSHNFKTNTTTNFPQKSSGQACPEIVEWAYEQINKQRQA